MLNFIGKKIHLLRRYDIEEIINIANLMDTTTNMSRPNQNRFINQSYEDFELLDQIYESINMQDIYAYNKKKSLLNPKFKTQTDKFTFFLYCCVLFSKLHIRNANNLDLLIFISTALDNNQRSLADYLLREYIKLHDTKDIEKMIVVAKFAYDSGITTPEIEKAVSVYLQVQENKKKS